MKWNQFDWKQFQEKDLTEDDVLHPIKRFGVNLVRSSKIVPNRPVPDNRDTKCSDKLWDEETLPSTSVVITFRWI